MSQGNKDNYWQCPNIDLQVLSYKDDLVFLYRYFIALNDSNDLVSWLIVVRFNQSEHTKDTFTSSICCWKYKNKL